MDEYNNVGIYIMYRLNIYLYDVIEINSNNLLKKEYCQGYMYSSIN